MHALLVLYFFNQAGDLDTVLSGYFTLSGVPLKVVCDSKCTLKWDVSSIGAQCTGAIQHYML